MVYDLNTDWLDRCTHNICLYHLLTCTIKGEEYIVMCCQLIKMLVSLKRNDFFLCCTCCTFLAPHINIINLGSISENSDPVKTTMVEKLNGSKKLTKFKEVHSHLTYNVFDVRYLLTADLIFLAIE